MALNMPQMSKKASTKITLKVRKEEDVYRVKQYMISVEDNLFKKNIEKQRPFQITMKEGARILDSELNYECGFYSIILHASERIDAQERNYQFFLLATNAFGDILLTESFMELTRFITILKRYEAIGHSLPIKLIESYYLFERK